MKALSLMQPMAWAMFHGKDTENRGRRFSHRGQLLIHASKNFNMEHYRWIVENDNRLVTFIPEHFSPVFVRGAIIGIVNVIDCVENHGSRWFTGPHALVVNDAREFAKPIPYRGYPGIFNVPDEIIKPELERSGLLTRRWTCAYCGHYLGIYDRIKGQTLCLRCRSYS